jgi:hypothetical protein
VIYPYEGNKPHIHETRELELGYTDREKLWGVWVDF